MIDFRRLSIVSGTFSAFAVLVALPVSAKVRVPALLQRAEVNTVYAPRAAILVGLSVSMGQHVKRGTRIASLQSPEIEKELAVTMQMIRALDVRLNRAQSVADDLTQRAVLIHERQSLDAKLKGLVAEKSKLEVLAPIDGAVLELNTDIQVGVWVADKEAIAVIGASGQLLVNGYVAESETLEVKVGEVGNFFADAGIIDVLPVQLKHINEAAADRLDLAELADTNGGHVESRPDAAYIAPRNAQYRATLSLLSQPKSMPTQVVRGVAVLPGNPQSLISKIWRTIFSGVIRESSF